MLYISIGWFLLVWKKHEIESNLKKVFAQYHHFHYIIKYVRNLRCSGKLKKKNWIIISTHSDKQNFKIFCVKTDFTLKNLY